MAETTIHGIEFQIKGSADEASKAIEKLESTLKRLKGVTGNGLGASAKSVASGFKSIQKEAKKTNSILSTFVKSLGRIAFYRAIRGALKSITQAFKEGLTNAYQFSKITGYELASAMDTLATKSLTMKNQMGAAFGGLLMAIQPVLLQIISLVTKAANSITQLMAILGGKSTYLKAIDTMTEFGESVSDTGQAAKEAMKYLAPFDELNVLPDDKNKGSGSGSSVPDYSAMFEETAVESDSLFGVLANMFNSIADWFEEQDWKSLGANVWNGIKESFSDTEKASDAVKALFRALGSVAGATVGFVWGFVTEAVESIFKSFKDSIKDYNGDNKIGITDILTGIWNFAITPLVWIDDNIVKPFWRGFTGALLGEEQEPITVSEFFDWAFKALTDNAITRWVKNKIITPIKNVFTSFSGDDEDNPGKSLGETILEGLAKPFKDVWAWVKEHIINPIKNALKNFSISSLLFGGDGEGSGGGVSGEANIDIKATMTKVGDWSQDVIDVIKEKGSTVTKTVKAAVAKATTWVETAASILGIKDGSTVTRTVKAAVDKAKTWVAEAANALGIKDGSTVTKTAQAAVNKAKTWIADAWTALTTKNGSTATKTVTTNVKQGSWDKNAFTASKMTDGTTWKDVIASATTSDWGWNDTAWEAANMKDGTAYKDVVASATEGTIQDNAMWILKGVSAGGGDITTRVSALNGKIGKAAVAVMNGIQTWQSYLTTRVNALNGTMKKGAMDAIRAKDKDVYVTVHTSKRDDINQNQSVQRALGGSYYGGKWHNIPQAASGGRFHGTLFWAGERGAEVVGHAGGRTEVLNKSQLASTMYSAVTKAMAGARISIGDMNAPTSGDSGYDEEAMYRAMLRALNDSDIGDSEIDLDGDVIWRKMVQRNRLNTRMTGVNAMTATA